MAIRRCDQVPALMNLEAEEFSEWYLKLSDRQQAKVARALECAYVYFTFLRWFKRNYPVIVDPEVLNG